VDQDDLALITRCRAGDVEAFEPLVEKYRNRVWRLAYQVVRDREEAWDVAQEAFIRAFQSLGAFRGQSAFYTWLFRIVVNLATDRVRQRAARNRALGGEPVSENEVEVVATVPDDPAARPDDEAARRQLHDRIAAGLDALPPNFRTIIMLSDVEGLSYREIAEVLDIPLGTVMSRLHNARKRLQKLLKPLLVVLMALWIGIPASPAAAQQAVSFGARVLLASDSAAGPVPQPGTAREQERRDEHLERIVAKLRMLFRYKEYTMLERYRAEVPVGVMKRWAVPGDRQLEVMPESVVDRAVKIRLRLARGSLTELNANIQAQSGSPALIGGPRFNDGVLIIVIWAHPKPAE
jgi:RNA polymerase sigma-70 factor (ECF subfamily)